MAGPRWAKFYVAPLQFSICFGAVVIGPLVAGQSLKVIRGQLLIFPLQQVYERIHSHYWEATMFNILIQFSYAVQFIYLLYNPHGTMKLYQFISICGVITMVLAQIPSFHSLRHINFISLLLCLAYGTCITIGATYIGKERKTQSYS